MHQNLAQIGLQSSSQRLQCPLLKEYTLNPIGIPIIIYGILLEIKGYSGVSALAFSGTDRRQSRHKRRVLASNTRRTANPGPGGLGHPRG